jgi:hypothetical protein
MDESIYSTRNSFEDEADDDECVENKEKMKMVDFIIICNCKGVYWF